MNNDILKFDITDEYRVLEQKLMQQYASDRHCWLDFTSITRAMFSVTKEGITFLAEQEKFCPYNKIVGAKEVETGIFLYMKKNCYLFLPVSNNDACNEALLTLSEQLRKNNIPYLRMDNLKGLNFFQKMRFALQKNKGAYVGTTIWLPLMLCIASVLCSIAFFVPIAQNYTIDRSQAIRVHGTYSNFEESVSWGSTRYIELYFNDLDSQEVDGCCTGELANKLTSVPAGTEMDILLHPKSNLVFEIKTDKETLLDFDMAQKKVRSEAIMFTLIACFMIIVATGCVIHIM